MDTSVVRVQGYSIHTQEIESEFSVTEFISRLPLRKMKKPFFWQNKGLLKQKNSVLIFYPVLAWKIEKMLTNFKKKILQGN